MFLETMVGGLLRSVRAGERQLIQNDPRLDGPRVIALSSPSFAEGAMMPQRCAASGVGHNLSPALRWDSVPRNAVHLAVILQDPDVPLPRPVTHLVAYGLDPGAGGVPEGAFNAGNDGAFHFGRGSFGRIGYQGPRPVAGHGPHRYVFQMFALGKPLSFDSPPDLSALAAAMAGSVLALGRLVGRYERA
jgi:Raf kinase inhibitor-like YbhB/YbcL family protein